jgi:hypothetical protein
VVSFSQSSSQHFGDGLSREVGPNASDLALRECGLSPDRSKLVPVRWIVEAGVFPRVEVSTADQVEVGGFWFSFSPAWQNLIAGGMLDYKDESFTLTDAAGNIVLPRNIERYTNARA